ILSNEIRPDRDIRHVSRTDIDGLRQREHRMTVVERLSAGGVGKAYPFEESCVEPETQAVGCALARHEKTDLPMHIAAIDRSVIERGPTHRPGQEFPGR